MAKEQRQGALARRGSGLLLVAALGLLGGCRDGEENAGAIMPMGVLPGEAGANGCVAAAGVFEARRIAPGDEGESARDEMSGWRACLFANAWGRFISDVGYGDDLLPWRDRGEAAAEQEELKELTADDAEALLDRMVEARRARAGREAPTACASASADRPPPE